jgi:hypothetical protein
MREARVGWVQGGMGPGWEEGHVPSGRAVLLVQMWLGSMHRVP